MCFLSSEQDSKDLRYPRMFQRSYTMGVCCFSSCTGIMIYGFAKIVLHKQQKRVYREHLSNFEFEDNLQTDMIITIKWKQRNPQQPNTPTLKEQQKRETEQIILKRYNENSTASHSQKVSL